MKNLKVPIIVSIFCLLLASGTSNAWEGFKFPNLNPFAKKKTTTKIRLSDSDKKSSMLPSLPKINLMPKDYLGIGPSIKKVSNGTKSAVTKTADFLNPFNEKKTMPPAAPSITGSQRTFQGRPTFSSKEPKKTEQNWFMKLITYEKDVTEPINSPQEFLRGTRPRIDD